MLRVLTATKGPYSNRTSCSNRATMAPEAVHMLARACRLHEMRVRWNLEGYVNAMFKVR